MLKFFLFILVVLFVLSVPFVTLDLGFKDLFLSSMRPPGLSLMPSSALVELLHRVEAAIREYSEELVNQLARRDELEFEKEVKNTFITALMEVQNRQKEQRESNKRKRRDKALSLQGGGTVTTNGGNSGVTGRTEKTGTMPVKVRVLLMLVFVKLRKRMNLEFLFYLNKSQKEEITEIPESLISDPLAAKTSSRKVFVQEEPIQSTHSRL